MVGHERLVVARLAVALLFRVEGMVPGERRIIDLDSLNPHREGENGRTDLIRTCIVREGIDGQVQETLCHSGHPVRHQLTKEYGLTVLILIRPRTTVRQLPLPLFDELPLLETSIIDRSAFQDGSVNAEDSCGCHRTFSSLVS